MVLKALSELAQAMRELARPETYARGSALQERIDVLRLFLVTSARETWPEVRIRTLDDVEAHSPTMAQQRRAVQRNVQSQAVSALHAWIREQPPPLPPHAKLARDASDAERDADGARHAAALEAREMEVEAAQRRGFGFSLTIDHSTAGHESGHGVFLGGKASIGSLIAFYPGLTYTPADILRLAGDVRRFEKNESLILRFDKHLLDASPSALKLLPPAAAAMPLAVAHRVNHPPAGVENNVLPCALDFEADAVPEGLRKLLPNVRFATARTALRRIEGGGASAQVQWHTHPHARVAITPVPQPRTPQKPRDLAVSRLPNPHVSYPVSPTPLLPLPLTDPPPPPKENGGGFQGMLCNR